MGTRRFSRRRPVVCRRLACPTGQAPGPLASLCGALLLTACTGASKPDTAAPAAFGDELGSVSLPGLADMALDGTQVFACLRGGDVLVVDISDPTAPDSSAGAPLGVPGGCSVVGAYASSVYSIAATGEVTRWSMNNLAVTGSEFVAQVPVSSTQQPGKRRLFLAGTELDGSDNEDTGEPEDTGAAGVDARLATIDLSSGVETLVSREADLSLSGATPVALGSDATHLFLGDSAGGLHVVGHDLQWVASLDLPTATGAPEAVLRGNPVVADDILFAGLGSAGLARVDVGDPEEPQLLGLVDGVDSAWDLAMVADRLYVGGSDSLMVLELSPAGEASLIDGGEITPAVAGRLSMVTVDRGVALAYAEESATLSLLNVDELSLP